MKLLWFWKRRERLSDIHHKKLQTCIHSEKVFEQILVRECVRCDRNGHRFSLVIFEVEEKTQEAIEKLVRILNNRHIRLCDEIGRFQKQHVAVILCYTNRQSALAFAENIRDISSSSGQSITFAVYEYPDNWQDIYQKSGNSQKHRFNGSSKKSDKRNSGKSNFYSRQEEMWSSEAISIRHNRQNLNISKHTMKTPWSFSYGIPVWKRGVDVFGSLLGLVLLLPLFLSLSLIIKIVSPGPLFVKEERVGFLGKRFTLLRFRTVSINSDNTRKQ